MPRSLEMQRRLHCVVLTTLQKHGYVEDRSTADFIVKLAAGTGEGPNPPAEHGNFVRSSPACAPAQGFVGIGINDAPSRPMVWQGSAFAEIDPAKIDDALLQRGVDQLHPAWMQIGIEK